MHLLACAAAADPTAAHSAPLDERFWPTWGDGAAEVASYDLVQPRYGEPRSGVATLIFVTEDFSWSARAKADPGDHPASDLRPVLKLNEVRDFRTGVYDYHVMRSVFLRVEPGDGMVRFAPIKAALSVTEWCGMVYDELRIDKQGATQTLHTYFDSDDTPPVQHKLPTDTVYGDALPLVVRGFGPGPGTYPYWPDSLSTRFAHAPAKPGQITIVRAGPETRSTPLGDWAVERWTTTTPDATTTWWVEQAWPHRIAGWSADTGESATLRGVDRMPYWSMNGGDAEAQRSRVGL